MIDSVKKEMQILFLIDKPYASDFLINTLRENHYPLVSTAVAREMIKDEELNWISEELATDILQKAPHTLLYTNSENALSWVALHSNGTALAAHIRLFKDKASFRELIRSLYPDFFFKRVKADEIPVLNLEGIPFPFVIKPTVGFFSLGVHIVRKLEDWNKVKDEVSHGKLEGIYPSAVLNNSTLLIEEYIEGEEFAVDCYFNNAGEAVVLNILHHSFSSGNDTSHRVYTVSKKMLLRYADVFTEFLSAMGQSAGIQNLPAHVELRIDAMGKIIPIEVNPLRFGGFCSTADLAGRALDYNMYNYYAHQQKPDWDQIFHKKGDKLYSLIVLNNNSGILPAQIKDFNYELLGMDFENVLEIRKLSIKEYPMFGFLFTETSEGNEEELTNILVSDLIKYIILE